MPKCVRIAIAGANDDRIFELVNSFSESKEIYFDLFGVGQVNRKFAGNVSYVTAGNDQDAVELAIEDIIAGADILFKGLVQTHTLLKEVLKKEYELVQGRLLSHVSILEIPELNRPVLLTDAAMNIDPTVDQEKEIIKNAIEIAHAIGIEHPKVSLISSAENFNKKMPSSVKAKELTDFYDHNRIDATVYGPLSLDLSLSKEVVAEKRFTGPIQGDADILVVPNIDVGNVLYKSLTMFTKTKVGGIIVGTKIPIVLTSRGDSLENKILALKFALKVI